MSIRIPTYNDHGELVELTYYDADEVARKLGGVIKARTVQRHTTGTIGDWPHIELRRSPYMTTEHIARVVELLTHDPDRIPEGDRPARLGIACTTNQLEDIAEPPPLELVEDDGDDAGEARR